MFAMNPAAGAKSRATWQTSQKPKHFWATSLKHRFRSAWPRPWPGIAKAGCSRSSSGALRLIIRYTRATRCAEAIKNPASLGEDLRGVERGHDSFQFTYIAPPQGNQKKS